MSAFSTLFNTLSSSYSTTSERRVANDNFESEQQQRRLETLARERRITDTLSGSTISKKIKDSGYNVVYDRLDGETNRAWANRTEENATKLTNIMNGASITQSTFNSGRIYLDVEKNSKAQHTCEEHAIG